MSPRKHVATNLAFRPAPLLKKTTVIADAVIIYGIAVFQISISLFTLATFTFAYLWTFLFLANPFGFITGVAYSLFGVYSALFLFTRWSWARAIAVCWLGIGADFLTNWWDYSYPPGSILLRVCGASTALYLAITLVSRFMLRGIRIWRARTRVTLGMQAPNRALTGQHPIPVIAVIVGMLHLMVMIETALPNLISFLLRPHAIDLTRFFSDVLYFPRDIVATAWIICFIGLWSWWRWAWWLAIVLDGVSLIAVVFKIVFLYFSGLAFLLRIPFPLAMGPTMTDLLAAIAFPLLLCPDVRQCYSVDSFIGHHRILKDMAIHLAVASATLRNIVKDLL